MARHITGNAGAGKKTIGRIFDRPVLTKLSLASDMSSRLKFPLQRQFSCKAVSVFIINSEAAGLLELECMEEGLQQMCQWAEKME